MIGDLKLSDLPTQADWESSPVPCRVQNCQHVGLDGRVGSKSYGELTIQEALTYAGKVCKPNHWLDPIMSPADFDRARVNRESYTPKRPDGKEETDESREQRRAERQQNKPVSLAKKVPVWDPVSMSMTYQ